MGAITNKATAPFGEPMSVDEFEQFWGREVLDNPMIGFNHYFNTAFGMPYKDPGNLELWVRKDGNMIFTLRNGHAIHPASDELVLQGYPYGLWPRRLQAVINAEIIRSKGATEIYVGPSFTPFFRKRLGIQMTGGATGSIKRAKDQMQRMAVATYRFYNRGGRDGYMYNPTPMIERCGVYFGDDDEHWPMILQISKAYRDSLCSEGNAIPVDIRALLKIEGAMEHDVYSWVVRRVYSIKPGKPVFISWNALWRQFGRTYSTLYPFQQDFRSIVGHIKCEVYPDVKFSEIQGGWKLASSKLAVPERKFWNGFTEDRQLPMFTTPDPDEPEETGIVEHEGERRVIAKVLTLKNGKL
jgi:hypothetical protein